jgi:hypothetical protein
MIIKKKLCEIDGCDKQAEKTIEAISNVCDEHFEDIRNQEAIFGHINFRYNHPLWQKKK